MKKHGFSDELIEKATTHNETNAEDIINARKTFIKYQETFLKEIKEEKEKVIKSRWFENNWYRKT